MLSFNLVKLEEPSLDLIPLSYSNPPPTIFEEVLGRLEQKDQYTVSCVCRKWRELTKKNLIAISFKPINDYIANITAQEPFVKDLSALQAEMAQISYGIYEIKHLAWEFKIKLAHLIIKMQDKGIKVPHTIEGFQSIIDTIRISRVKLAEMDASIQNTPITRPKYGIPTPHAEFYQDLLAKEYFNLSFDIAVHIQNAGLKFAAIKTIINKLFEIKFTSKIIELMDRVPSDMDFNFFTEILTKLADGYAYDAAIEVAKRHPGGEISIENSIRKIICFMINSNLPEKATLTTLEHINNIYHLIEVSKKLNALGKNDKASEVFSKLSLEYAKRENKRHSLTLSIQKLQITLIPR